MKRVHCIGCSWSRHWPEFLDKETLIVSRTVCDGKGLWFFHQEQLLKRCRSEAKRADHIVLQLPTPVRSINPADFRRQTTKVLLDLIQKMWQGKVRQMRNSLLKTYQQEIESLAREFPKIVFLIFNTGGYPFRCPYDFGPDTQAEMVTLMEQKGLSCIVVDFEGKAGHCTQEMKVSGKDTMPQAIAPTIQPKGGKMWIIDAHPNEAACGIAAALIGQHLLSRD